jgi:hypothetical protein
MVHALTKRDRRKAMKKGKKSRAVPKARKVKVTKKIAPRQTSAGKARAEGMRLFKLAGRPSKESGTALAPKSNDESRAA